MNPHLTSLQGRVVRGCRLRDFKPGEELPPERVLAGASGVGRSAVRGMLAALQRAGIVERSHRGWILLRRIPEPRVAEEGSKRQRAKDFLLAELSGGRLRPGDQISELGLATKVGVSTVSIREALLEMQPLGLLTKKERQKWEVATFSDERIAEMREFREMVEVFCLRKLLAKGLSDERRAGFKGILVETNRLLRQPRPAIKNILRADLSFHRLLLESPGNTLIKERAGFIYLIIEFQFVSPFYMAEAGKSGLTQHLRIIENILRADPPSAEAHLIEHLRSAEQTFCAIVKQFRK